LEFFAEIDRQNLDLISRLDSTANPDAIKEKFEHLVNFEQALKNYFKHEQEMRHELRCPAYAA